MQDHELIEISMPVACNLVYPVSINCKECGKVITEKVSFQDIFDRGVIADRLNYECENCGETNPPPRKYRIGRDAK